MNFKNTLYLTHCIKSIIILYIALYKFNWEILIKKKFFYTCRVFNFWCIFCTKSPSFRPAMFPSNRAQGARGCPIGRHRYNQCWKVKKDQALQSHSLGPGAIACHTDIHLWSA